jgi:hypothetical protein
MWIFGLVIKESILTGIIGDVREEVWAVYSVWQMKTGVKSVKLTAYGSQFWIRQKNKRHHVAAIQGWIA